MMNNKQTGTAFEQEVVEYFRAKGYWVHFIAPDARGAQPFDIIAVKNGFAIAVECKTLADTEKSFPIDRLEDNQKFAFDYWERCGNAEPLIAVKWRGKIKFIGWDKLRSNTNSRVKME